VAGATEISYATIQRGLQELKTKRSLPPGRIRHAGGGRKRTVDKDPTLVADLERDVRALRLVGDLVSASGW
jgi:hypothetical protein